MTTRSTSETLVLVPMKDPAASKTRLAGRLKSGERQRLSQHLFRQTLLMLRQAQRLAEFDIAVVTGSGKAQRIADQHWVIVEPEDAGLNGALEHAAGVAMRSGYRRLCVLPADLAAPVATDVAAFLLEQEGVDLRLCPSWDGGTNALLVSLPCGFEFAYGRGSARRHFERATAAGLVARFEAFHSLRFDIDTRDCLDQALRFIPDLAEVVAVE